MKTRIAVLYDTDFTSDTAWKMFLDMLGVDQETVVNGKVVPIEYTSVEFNVMTDTVNPQ